MNQKQLAVSCPICGRKNNFSAEMLFEGAKISCPLCKVTLTLHGHMWEEIKRELDKLKHDARLDA